MPVPTSESDRRHSYFGGGLELEPEDLLRLLPHRRPLLMLDRVLALEPGVHAVGFKLITGNECGLSSRDHGFVFPATLALEALVQLATVTLRYPGGLDAPPVGPAPVFLREVESLVIHREMISCGQLQLSLAVLGRGQGGTRWTGQAALAGEPYVDAVFWLQD